MDLVSIATAHLSGGGACGGAVLMAAVRRLAGCLDARPAATLHDDKRPAGTLSLISSRGTCGGDVLPSVYEEQPIDERVVLKCEHELNQGGLLQ